MGEAIFRQKNGMIAVNIVASCGVMTADQLSGLARLSQECGVFRVKLTSRQTLVAVLDEDKAGSLISGLPGLGLRVSPFGNVVRAVKSCPGGSDLCPRSIGDSLGLGIEIQDRYLGMEVPKDFKIAVAGCTRGCTDPFCADLGIIAAGREVFDVAIGGYGGSLQPIHGKLIARKIKKEDIFSVIDHVLMKFKELGEPKEKLGHTILRVGLSPFLPSSQIKEAAQEPPEDFLEFLK